MTKENSTFQYFIGGLLRIVSNEVSRSFTKKMATKGISPGEWLVLRTLFETSIKTPGEVAGYIGFSKGAISKIVDKLTEKNLIIRKEIANDRRYQEIKLTKEANALVPNLIEIAEENDLQFFSCLKKAEREKLRHVLKKIAKENDITGIPIK